MAYDFGGTPGGSLVSNALNIAGKQQAADAPSYAANPNQVIPGIDNTLAYNTLAKVDWTDPNMAPALGQYMQANNISPDMLAASLNAGGGNNAFTGEAVAGFVGQQYQPDNPGPQVFQPSLFPFSQTQSGGTTQSQSQSQNYAGLGPTVDKQITGAMVPNLLQKALALPGQIDQWGQDAQNLAERQVMNVLQRAMPKLQGQLGNNNMLMSSVAGDAQAKMGSAAAQNLSDRAYQTAMDTAKMQMAVPDLWTKITDLARHSTGTSSASSSGTTQSQSFQADPSKPYSDYMDFIATY